MTSGEHINHNWGAPVHFDDDDHDEYVHAWHSERIAATQPVEGESIDDPDAKEDE